MRWLRRIYLKINTHQRVEKHFKEAGIKVKGKIIRRK